MRHSIGGYTEQAFKMYGGQLQEITIQKAYQELEKLGYIYTVKGRGNFVASHTSWKVDRKNEYLEIMNDALRELKALGVSRDEVVASIDSLYKD